MIKKAFYHLREKCDIQLLGYMSIFLKCLSKKFPFIIVYCDDIKCCDNYIYEYSEVYFYYYSYFIYINIIMMLLLYVNF